MNYLLLENKSNFQYLKIEKEVNEQLLNLLKENTIGMPGESMVYKHHDVSAKVKMLSEPYFANLSIRDKLYGTVCFSKRNVFISGKKFEAFYLRYFTFQEKLRSTKAKNSTSKSTSKIREEIARLMNGQGLDYRDSLIMYAYVDADNIRSLRLIDEFGFRKISSYRVIPFSRIFPKKSKFVNVANSSLHMEIEANLLEMYRKEQLVSFEHLFTQGDYFVYKMEGKVICGVQAIPDQWDILDMPGFAGKMMMNIIPNIPIINRLFHPNFKFVFFESIFCHEGYEHHLGTLFQSVLAHYKVYSGIMCLDQKSRVYGMVKKNGLGLSHKIQGEKEIDVVVKTSDDNILNAGLPINVSGFDVL